MTCALTLFSRAAVKRRVRDLISAGAQDQAILDSLRRSLLE